MYGPAEDPATIRINEALSEIDKRFVLGVETTVDTDVKEPEVVSVDDVKEPEVVSETEVVPEPVPVQTSTEPVVEPVGYFAYLRSWLPF